MTLSTPFEYPDEDLPFTLYFNGIEMPKWSNVWPGFVSEDPYYDFYLKEVWRRIDHTGLLESEDGPIFIFAAQETLLWVIDHRSEFLETMEAPDFILNEWIDGVCRMIKLAESSDVVFWTSGYENDNARLLDLMRKYSLGESHPEYVIPPHRKERTLARERRIEQQRKQLRIRLNLSGLGKPLKSFIHQLPKRA